MQRQSVLCRHAIRIRGCVRPHLLLADQERGDVGTRILVLEECSQPETRHRVIRVQVEHLVRRPALCVRTVDRGSAVGHRVAGEKRRHVRQQFAPSHGKRLAAAVGRQAAGSRQPKGSAARVVLRVTDKSREVAAGKKIGASIESAAVGNGLVRRVVLVAVVVRMKIVGNEFGIVVGTVQISFPTNANAMLGGEGLPIGTVITDGNVAGHLRAALAYLELPQKRQCPQQ